MPVMEYIVQQPLTERLHVKGVLNYRLRDLQGNYHSLLQQVIPLLLDVNGNPAYAAVVTYDITPIKKDTDIVAYAVHRDAQGRDHIVPLQSPDTAPKLRSSSNILLSKREREVAHMLTQGLSAKMVAARLHISPQTVAVHRRNLLRKTGSPNQAALAAFVVRAGL